MIEACRNGKDVYCQKPETRTLREGPLMVAAARRYGRVVSGGSQRVLEDYREHGRPVLGRRAGHDQVDQRQRRPAVAALQPAGRAGARRHGLGHVARPGPLGPVQPRPLRRQLRHRRRQLAVVQRLLGRRHDRLGRAPLRRRAVRRDVREWSRRKSSTTTKRTASTSTYRFPNGMLVHHNHPDTGNLQVVGTPGEKRPPKPVPTYKGTGGIYGDFLDCVQDARSGRSATSSWPRTP